MGFIASIYIEAIIVFSFSSEEISSVSEYLGTIDSTVPSEDIESNQENLKESTEALANPSATPFAFLPTSS